MIKLKGNSSTSCSLCSALEKELNKASGDGETERVSVLKVLLKGHKEACHQAN